MEENNFNPCGKLFRGKNNYNLYQGIAYSLDMEQLIKQVEFVRSLTQGDIEGAIVQTTPIQNENTCSLGATTDSFVAAVFGIPADGQAIAVAPLPKFEGRSGG